MTYRTEAATFLSQSLIRRYYIFRKITLRMFSPDMRELRIAVTVTALAK